MRTDIRRVAVLGAGVMGSGIAAHLANVGVSVLLLDIVPAKRLTMGAAYFGLLVVLVLGMWAAGRPLDEWRESEGAPATLEEPWRQSTSQRSPTPSPSLSV